MNGAVIYARVSTQEQVSGFSLDTQEQACRDYASREGYEVIRVFREEGESAKTTDRTQFLEMVNYCTRQAKQLGIRAVIVYRVDRFARNAPDHHMVRVALKKVGVVLRAAQETIDESPQGALMEGFFAVMAQFDNDMRALRTRDGMRAAAENGRWLWQPPLGYRRPPDGSRSPSLVPDPASAPLIQLAFEMAADPSANRQSILRHITELGLRSRRGRALSAQSFAGILRNPVYTGRISVPRWEFEGPGDFVALVSLERFHEVNRGPQGAAERLLLHPDFPLRRLVRCHACGGGLTASWSTGRNRRYGYYRCHHKGCHAVNVRKEDLERAFDVFLGTRTFRPEAFRLLRAILADAWRHRVAVAAAARARLVERGKDLSAKHDRLVDAFVQETIDRPTFESRRVRLEQEMAQIAREIALLGGIDELDLSATLSAAEGVLTDLRGCWNRLSAEHRSRFVSALFPEGLVFESGTVGTADEPWLLWGLDRQEPVDSEMAPPKSVDWNRMETWLRGVGALAPIALRSGERASSSAVWAEHGDDVPTATQDWDKPAV
jgi:DNA invertase Pin-like site-specific DNA recombinase